MAGQEHRLIVELDSESCEHQTCTDLLTLGDVGYAHSGMVRSIFEHGTNMAWHELEQRFATGK